MGLLDKLTKEGSQYSIANGGKVDINPLSTKTSDLMTYSLDGSNASKVNASYQQYVDGTPNTLPKPSELDLDGKTPKSYASTGPTEGHY